MNRILLTNIFIFFLVTYFGNREDCFSQNMVNNPGFEEYFSCPVYEDQLDLCKYWFNTTNSSPDYFNKCAKKDIGSQRIYFGVPANTDGYQMARAGQAYVGIINFNHKYFTGREFICTQLKKILEAGKTYKFGMYVSLADSSQYYNNRFGFCFSKEKTLPSESKNNEYNVYFCSNSIVIINDNIGKDTVSWHLVQGEYQAKGGEEYFMIGLCKGNITKKEYKQVKRKNKTYVGNLPDAYYYIDDVFVEEKK